MARVPYVRKEDLLASAIVWNVINEVSIWAGSSGQQRQFIRLLEV